MDGAVCCGRERTPEDRQYFPGQEAVSVGTHVGQSMGHCSETRESHLGCHHENQTIKADEMSRGRVFRGRQLRALGPASRVTSPGTGTGIGGPKGSEKVAGEAEGKPTRAVSLGSPSEEKTAPSVRGC